jgi:hypothetical protein
VARTIKRERRDSSTARVPSVPPGTAIVFTRYGDEKTVVMNPEDFRRLAELDDWLEDAVLAPIEMSELAMKAHSIEDTPGDAIEDPARIKALLGL